MKKVKPSETEDQPKLDIGALPPAEPTVDSADTPATGDQSDSPLAVSSSHASAGASTEGARLTPIEKFVNEIPVAHDSAIDLPPPTDNELFIPIHDFIWLSDAEIDIINHPAFLRLANIFQLGQAHLAYRGATHKRIEHVLGSVHVAQMIITAIVNNHRQRRTTDEPNSEDGLSAPLNTLETVFVRLAALLHDIGHLPAGHTLEDELELLPKHDKRERVDYVLNRPVWFGVKCEPLRTLIDRLYLPYVANKNITASQLAVQIVAKDPDPALATPPDFRLEVCRDIVGNTICADFLDYIYRDWWHIGKPRDFDRRIFQYMEIRRNPETGIDEFVISLGDAKRLRTDAITAIVNLLEYRYQLAEVVLFHRTKCKGAAMLERAMMELSPIDSTEEDRHTWATALVERLLDHSDWSALLDFHKMSENVPAARIPIEALLHRRLYREASSTFVRNITPPGRLDVLRHKYSTGPNSAQNRLRAVRQLESDFRLPHGSIAMYCPHAGMNAKLPEVSIHLEGWIHPYQKWIKSYGRMLDGGHIEAQLERFKNLWRVQVVVEQSVWDKWSPMMHTLFQRAVNTFVLNEPGSEELTRSELTEEFARQMVAIADSPYANQPLLTAAQWQENDDATYPFGAPAIRTFFEKH